MAMAMLFLELPEPEEKEEEILQLHLARRRLCDDQNVFNLPEILFKNLFSIYEILLRDLLTELRPHLERERPTSLSVETQIKFPATPEAREAAKRKFANAPQPLLGAIGPIDCTRIAIVASKRHEEGFVNHHRYHSVNVEMILSRSMHFKCKCPICRMSSRCCYLNAVTCVQTYGAMLQRREAANMVDGLVTTECDSGYPLKPWLLTPISNALNGSPEYIYTTAHCSARSIIERCFGRLSSVWPMLSRCMSCRRFSATNDAINDFSIAYTL